MDQLQEQNKKIHTLHRYLIWADRMRVHFQKELRNRSPNFSLLEDIELFLYMSYWYAATYVVIEGWIELSLHDERVAELLKSPNVDLLKRYRNGVFHFQREYFDGRFVDFMSAEGTPTWVHQLREELSRYFLEWAKKREEHD